jgi:hypothetical protein
VANTLAYYFTETITSYDRKEFNSTDAGRSLLQLKTNCCAVPVIIKFLRT